MVRRCGLYRSSTWRLDPPEVTPHYWQVGLLAGETCTERILAASAEDAAEIWCRRQTDWNDPDWPLRERVTALCKATGERRVVDLRVSIKVTQTATIHAKAVPSRAKKPP